MTKDVLISISGLHYDAVEGDTQGEPVEVITPANYYLKNGKHYIVYDEVVEGMPGTIKNTIKLTGDTMFEMKKSGLTGTHMVFEKDRIHMSDYETPYGRMMLGIHTRDMKVNIEEEKIEIHIDYSLDVDGDPLSDCEIDVTIKGVRS